MLGNSCKDVDAGAVCRKLTARRESQMLLTNRNNFQAILLTLTMQQAGKRYET